MKKFKLFFLSSLGGKHSFVISAENEALAERYIRNNHPNLLNNSSLVKAIEIPLNQTVLDVMFLQ